MPTLNERDNVGPLVAALDRAMGDYDREIVFVDDWSCDGTPEVIEVLARERSDIRLIRRHGRRGLSSAVIEGMLATFAPVVAVIDADLQHDEAILPMLVDAVNAGADVSIGSRYAAGGSCGEWNAMRALGSRIATRLARLVVPASVTDPMSGFFVIQRSLVLATVPQMDGRGFKILLDLLSAQSNTLCIVEVPFTFRGRAAGESKLGAHVLLNYGRILLKRGIAQRMGRGRAEPRYAPIAQPCEEQSVEQVMPSGGKD